MHANRLTPILNVSNIQQTFAWFEKLGWTKSWEWGDPADFGGVCSGECEIFLCQGAQGGRGKSALAATFGRDNNDAADKGVWMSIWVDDVDAVHAQCMAQDLEVTWPPTDMPWNVREMHVRHPDGHVFRISREIEDTRGMNANSSRGSGFGIRRSGFEQPNNRTTELPNTRTRAALDKHQPPPYEDAHSGGAT